MTSVALPLTLNGKTLTFKSSKGTGQSDLIFLSATSRATALARSSFPIT